MPGSRSTLLSAFLDQRDALLRFLQRRLGNMALAEDLAQETWLRAAGADGATAIDNPTAYLYRIATNLARDHQRHVAHHIEVQVADETVAVVADPRPTPEMATLHRSELERLQQLVNGLSPRSREVFILAKVEGLTYAAIADRLGIARTTVITHMVNALVALEEGMREGEAQAPRKSSPAPSTSFPRRAS
ncbi:RNA polymerase sigma factor [Azospirillum sp. ST 5-10]|uniref:RNA polymerase sigma factor n=1 Tax=unclassified Azospirillum TaxID=2630922 RepID=UPI003F4A0EE6